MIKQALLEDYVSTVQKLRIREDQGEDSLPDLMELIDEKIKDHPMNRGYQEFFRGEQAFYNGQYKLALMHYLAAKEVPSFRFFCYRASAYVSEKFGHKDKAIEFAKKALDVCPHDYMTLKLLETVLSTSSSVGAAIEHADIHQRLDAVKQQLDEQLDIERYFTDSPAESADDTDQSSDRNPKISLGVEELNELTSLFLSKKAPDSYDAPLSSTTNYAALASKALTAAKPFQITINKISTSTTEPEMDRETAYMATPTMERIEDLSETEQPTSSYTLRNTAAIDQLQQLANSDYSIENESTSRFISDNLGIDLDSCQTLEQRVRTFQKTHARVIAEYAQLPQKRVKPLDNCLYVLQGWEQHSQMHTQDASATLARFLATEHPRKSSGGFFLRWKGVGVVINPGHNFLKNFHQQGLHITDIDCVIVTRDTPSSYADIKAIYDLNYKINAGRQELHIINYYLNQQTHRDISASLKPNFKQERKSVHGLELYVDSPDVEKIDLSDEITLHYFPTTAQESPQQAALKERRSGTAPCLGIRLELKNADSRSTPIHVGYLSGTPWSPVLAHHLDKCDLLVAGFDSTNANDYGKLRYNSDCLGYFGTSSLMEAVSPRLLLSCEFGGREGDIRLEAVRKIREEYAYDKHKSTVVLPGDTGLNVDLNSLKVRCSVSHALVDPTVVRIVKSTDSFGKLEYLSPGCCI